MHVGVVTIVHHPQDARIFQRQIRALLDSGAAVTYAAPWRATGARPPEGLSTVDLPRASGRHRLHAVRAARAALRRLAPSLDLLLVHDPELVPATVGLGTLPVVWDVHEDTASALSDKPWLPRPLRPAVRRIVAALEHQAERRLHLLLAEHRYAARFAQSHPIVPNETLVPSRVPPSGRERIVYLGRLSHGRGAEELLALAERLPAETALHLIGPAGPELADRLRRAAREGHLTWHGFLPNPEALALVEGAAAGLSLLHDEPNYRHSRPTKVVEYMARGVPVVSTPTPVAAEIVETHRCGVVVPFGDVNAAAAAIRTLVSDDSRRANLAEAGHRAALAHFDWRTSSEVFVAQLQAWAREG